MNIKDFIEIEPKQKHIIITSVGLFSISFLQIFLFKRELMNGNFLILIVISLALSFFWYLVNSLSVIFFFLSLKSKSQKEDKEPTPYLIITFLGFLFLSWIFLLTFIAYEKRLSFNEFIKASAIISIIKSFFWFSIYFIKTELKRRKTNREKLKLNQ